MNSALLCDGYKLSHPPQFPKNTTLAFTNFTPRSDGHAPEGAKGSVVVFGTQFTFQSIHEHFAVNFFRTEERLLFYDTPKRIAVLKKKVLTDLKNEIDLYLNCDYDISHFEALWDLGYLPIEVRALDEGTECPIKVPMLTVHNTLPEFFWLPNFLETIISNMLWKPMTSATIARAYKRKLNKWALDTDKDNVEFVNWQGHDFSMRGLDSIDATISSGMGHLTSFYGSDSLPAVYGTRKFYDAEGFVAGSVPATEHSVMCAGSKEDELGTFKRLLETYKDSPILSVVSDTWDLWNVLTVILPQLKEQILAGNTKLVIRPDSGDPVEIICGESVIFDREITQENVFAFANGRMQHRYFHKDGNYYYIYEVTETTCDWVHIEKTPRLVGVIELLWDLFGGTINEQGFKVLDPHIGAIYGDSITLERAEKICSRLAIKGFASTNIVFGVGSFTYQFNTRDTYGFAMKATYVEIIEAGCCGGPTGSQECCGDPVWEPVGYEIFKDPITDSGVKKSAKGLLKVVKEGDTIVLKDGITWEELKQPDNLLHVRYRDGEFYNTTTFEEIRNNLKE